jgi:sugar phosphate isomerase/epimerase
VRVFTGYENPAAAYSAQWKLVVESLRECARRAADFGVTLGVQNHHDLGTAWQSQYDLIREVDEPNCKAVFDAWAPALHGADLVAAARKMAPLTVQTIVANYQLRPRFRYDPAIVNFSEQKPALSAVPVDEGFIDYAAFLEALYQGGFRGNIVYEMCSPLRDGNGRQALDRYALRFVEFVREQKRKLGCGEREG